MPFVREQSGGTIAIPKTPTASSKFSTTIQYNLVQLTNEYSVIYGNHKASGNCVVTLYYYDSNGYQIGMATDILNIGGIVQRQANISVPSGTTVVRIDQRGNTFQSDFWFS